MSWNYPHFTKKEMACHCGCGLLPLPWFMGILEEIREEAGFPFIISSAARCAAYNQQVSDTGPYGPHTHLTAVDVRIYGKRAIKLVELALKYKATGIGVSQKGLKEDRFIHIDFMPLNDLRPWIWSY